MDGAFSWTSDKLSVWDSHSGSILPITFTLSSSWTLSTFLELRLPQTRQNVPYAFELYLLYIFPFSNQANFTDFKPWRGNPKISPIFTSKL